MSDDNIIYLPIKNDDGDEMTMRDYFASQVMIGLMFRDSDISATGKTEAVISYLIADAMMEARKK